MWTRFFSQIVHAVHEAFAVHRVQYIMAISIISDVLGSHGLEGSREFWQKAYHGTQDICYSLYGTHIAKAEDSSLIHTKKPFSWVCWGRAWFYTFMPSHMKQKRPHTFFSVYQGNMQQQRMISYFSMNNEKICERATLVSNTNSFWHLDTYGNYDAS